VILFQANLLNESVDLDSARWERQATMTLGEMLMFGRRTFTTGAIAAGILAPAATLRAEDFPTRQITLVAPFPAGTVTDSAARALAQQLHDAFGPPVVVDNRAGG
jgi:hypothetical protein